MKLNITAYLKDFRYRRDGILGGWRISTQGDCEDFAISVAYIFAGHSKLRLIWGILTLKYVFWFCRADWNNQTHWILWVRGKGYIDNIHPEWAHQTPHKKLLPALWIVILMVPFA
jgi:hypothetical protein